MRIVVIGQAAFGEAVFKALREKGEEVVGVCAPATPKGGKPDSLRVAAAAAGLAALPTRQLRKDEGVVQKYLDLKPDLNVMAFVTDIIPERVLFAPTRQTIQYHPSLLPRHRGASAINWAIIQGDTRTGLSIFWPDQGIDTGPILMQKEVEIGPDDTVGSVYFNQLFPLGVQSLVESVELVRTGKAPRLDQDHSQATYEPICKDEHALIRWERDASEVYNLIRGTNPQPGAIATLDGQRVRIFDTERKPELKGKPGEVVAVGPEGISVALSRGGIVIKRLQPQGGGKVAAAAFAQERGVKAGQRLGDGRADSP
ncbi:MAG: methionyl-tRNA formyltransferase [Gemmatimonadetes bacterium]|nr:methionyl-tRNA formyltransferase [Gemmatimonadota bacterium]